MRYMLTTGNKKYSYDPDKKEFAVGIDADIGEGNGYNYYKVTPQNIATITKYLTDDNNDEDYNLYDMLKFLKNNNVMDDYNDAARELAERYSDKQPVWLDDSTIEKELGLEDKEDVDYNEVYNDMLKEIEDENYSDDDLEQYIYNADNGISDDIGKVRDIKTKAMQDELKRRKQNKTQNLINSIKFGQYDK